MTISRGHCVLPGKFLLPSVLCSSLIQAFLFLSPLFLHLILWRNVWLLLEITPAIYQMTRSDWTKNQIERCEKSLFPSPDQSEIGFSTIKWHLTSSRRVSGCHWRFMWLSARWQEVIGLRPTDLVVNAVPWRQGVLLSCFLFTSKTWLKSSLRGISLQCFVLLLLSGLSCQLVTVQHSHCYPSVPQRAGCSSKNASDFWVQLKCVAVFDFKAKQSDMQTV